MTGNTETFPAFLPIGVLEAPLAKKKNGLLKKVF